MIEVGRFERPSPSAHARVLWGHQLLSSLHRTAGGTGDDSFAATSGDGVENPTTSANYETVMKAIQNFDWTFFPWTGRISFA